MVTHLVSLIFFFTLSCADLHWNELASMIYKLKGQNTYKNGTNFITCQNRCTSLNTNPVLFARNFQYRVKKSFIDIIIDDMLGKSQCCAVGAEFQVRSSAYLYKFVFYTKDLIALITCIEHIDTKVTDQLQDENIDPRIYCLVKTF